MPVQIRRARSQAQKKAQHIEFQGGSEGQRELLGLLLLQVQEGVTLGEGHFCYSSFSHTLTHLFREVS